MLGLCGGNLCGGAEAMKVVRVFLAIVAGCVAVVFVGSCVICCGPVMIGQQLEQEHIDP